MPTISKSKYKEVEKRIEQIFSTEMEVEDFTGVIVPSSQDLPDKNKGYISQIIPFYSSIYGVQQNYRTRHKQ